MRLFRRKKNNRGFSLVETVCAVAIIGLTSTAIGSAMIMSTDNYQRGNTEVDVQKEAQLATNLIGNLLVDATDASYTGNTLTIYGEGIEYEIVYDPATKKLTYKETKGASVTTGTLAENVTNFKPNLDNWDSMNARIDMAIEKNGRNYEASYNTTARNAASFNVGSAESAFVICETELVLEPGQVYDLPVAIYGNPDVPGVDLVKAQSSLTGANLGTTSLDDYDDGITIEVGDDASGMFTFVVETAAKETGTNIALDAKTVTVKIRRATDIDKTLIAPTVPSYSAGTTYQIAATVTADYPDKIIGKEFDDDYKDPRKVAFTVVDDGTVVENFDYRYTITDNQINLTLINDLPQGSKITVNMTAAHAFGGNNNKTGHAYDTTVKDSYVIENNRSRISPKDSGIKRGDDNFLTFEADYDRAGMVSDFGLDMNNSRYMFRYRRKELGASDNSPYYRFVQGSTQDDKFNAIETWLWYVGYTYEIDVIMVVVDNVGSSQPKLRYPQDESLLADLNLTYPGIVKGWTDADLAKPNAATQLNEYGGTLEVGAGMLQYDEGDRIGSETTAGFNINRGDSNRNYRLIKFSGINMKASHFDGTDYGFDVYWRTENTTWNHIDDYSSYFGVQFSNTEFRLKDFKKSAEGKYFKIVPTVKNKFTKVNSIPNGSHPDYAEKQTGADDMGKTVYPVANKDTGQGCIYFYVEETNIN